jgi:hypothetical protein
MNPTSFVFVAQAGNLEGMSLALAASLRTYAGFSHELIAAVPAPASVWGSLSKGTMDAFEELEVTVRNVENPFGREYPIGNKFGCLLLAAGKVAAVPASKLHHTREQWQNIYAAAGISMPCIEPAEGATRSEMPPYFNAGMISVDPDIGFGSVWLECAQNIEADQSIPISARRPWLDQIALPVAAAKLGIEVHALSVDYNFPSWDLSRQPSDKTVFYHYRRPSFLFGNSDIFGRASRAVSSFPAARREVGRYPRLSMLGTSGNYWLKKLYIFMAEIWRGPPIDGLEDPRVLHIEICFGIGERWALKTVQAVHWIRRFVLRCAGKRRRTKKPARGRF